MASRFWRLKALTAASIAALLAACATPPPLTPEEIEAQAWISAQQADTPFAYQEYLRQYGDRPNAEGARQRVEALMQEERAAWAQARRIDTEEAYENYLRLYSWGADAQRAAPRGRRTRRLGRSSARRSHCGL
jgi:type IV pilus biogenesis protein CpaD/CtpE